MAVNLSGGIKTEDGRILFGIDAETYLKMKAKEDPHFEKKSGHLDRASLKRRFTGSI